MTRPTALPATDKRTARFPFPLLDKLVPRQQRKRLVTGNAEEQPRHDIEERMGYRQRTRESEQGRVFDAE